MFEKRIETKRIVLLKLITLERKISIEASKELQQIFRG
jgi:hypothetical protein